MKNLVNSAILCRNNEQIFSNIDGDIVMLNITNSEYYNLNSVAGFIWNYFDQPKSLDSLLIILRNKYEVSEDICEQDVKMFISELLNKGLIKVLDGKN